jgi:general secretion pathway protein G
MRLANQETSRKSSAQPLFIDQRHLAVAVGIHVALWEAGTYKGGHTMMNRDSKGFTLIELLIVVAIIGIIAAIAIPNLLNAIDRGKQKRTMADMRSIGTAVESYAVDNNIYPVAASALILQGLVQPVYIKTMPLNDGWNNTFVVNSIAAQYTISSNGKDGASSGCVTGTLTTLFNQDICFANGQFVQYPQGSQQ